MGLADRDYMRAPRPRRRRGGFDLAGFWRAHRVTGVLLLLHVLVGINWALARTNETGALLELMFTHFAVDGGSVSDGRWYVALTSAFSIGSLWGWLFRGAALYLLGTTVESLYGAGKTVGLTVACVMGAALVVWFVELPSVVMKVPGPALGLALAAAVVVRGGTLNRLRLPAWIAAVIYLLVDLIGPGFPLSASLYVGAAVATLLFIAAERRLHRRRLARSAQRAIDDLLEP